MLQLNNPDSRHHTAVAQKVRLRLVLASLALALVLSSLGGGTCLAEGQLGEQPGAAAAQEPPSGGQPSPGGGNAEAVAAVNAEPGDSGDPTPKECLKANKTAYYGAAGMDAAVLLAFFLLLSVAAKRNWISTNPMTRFTALLLPFASAAAALSGFVIFEKGTVMACLKSTDLRSLLDIAGMAAWQRGMMLGMLPVIVLAFVIQIVRKAVSR